MIYKIPIARAHICCLFHTKQVLNQLARSIADCLNFRRQFFRLARHPRRFDFAFPEKSMARFTRDRHSIESSRPSCSLAFSTNNDDTHSLALESLKPDQD